MTAQLVSAWTDDGKVHLVERKGDQVFIRRVPAKWEFFVTGLDDVDRGHLSRDRRVRSVVREKGYDRIECRDRWERNEVTAIIETAARAKGSADRIKVLEGDVSPLRRLMSDYPDLEVDPSPRLAFFDIETDSRKTFVEMREGKARVLSWALEGADGKKFSGLLAADTDNAERALLTELLEAFRDYDCLLAWYGAGFDFQVIQMRAHVLKMQYRGRDIPWHRWTWLDHLEVFKKYNMHSDDGGEAKASYKLDHVATYLLGEGKKDFDASKTWEAWAAGGAERDRLLAYNIQDTALLPRIEAKTGFVSLHLAVCHICRVFPDTESLHATVQGDGFMLRLGSEYGYRWPTKPKVDENAERQQFAGAYVMEPKRKGAVENVHVCDFAGLYPSIMRTWNMSLDTKVARPDSVDRSKLLRLPDRPTYFRNDTDGMFRIALDRLVAKRAEYTKKMKEHAAGTEQHAFYKRLSGAFKIVANSFYGIAGSVYSRFFDPEIAEGVTQTGKWLLIQVLDGAAGRGWDPFYGDTDSGFVTGVDTETFRKFVDEMNGRWDEILAPFGVAAGKHHIDLDFEKTFHRLIMVSAKRYAGLYAMYKGKAATGDAKEVKGLEFKRGDAIRMAREFQSEVVNALLALELPQADAIRVIIDRWRDKVLNGDLELADVTLSQALTRPLKEYADRFSEPACKGCQYWFGGTDGSGKEKCPSCGVERVRVKQPAHVRVAREMQDAGIPLAEGARVSYLIVKDGDDHKPVMVDADRLPDLDRLYYWENRVYPPVERVVSLVYPQYQWTETGAAKKMREREANGQMRLDLSSGGKEPMPEAQPRRRQKKAVPTAKDPEVVIVVHTEPPGKADEKVAALRMEALNAALAAHPGAYRVRLVFEWQDEGKPVQVEMPTSVTVDVTQQSKKAILRAIGSGEVQSRVDLSGGGQN